MNALDCSDCSDAIFVLTENKGLTDDEFDEKYGDAECRCKRAILCDHCHKPATNETNTLSIHVCEENECVLELATQEWVNDELSDSDHEEYGEVYDKGKWQTQ